MGSTLRVAAALISVSCLAGGCADRQAGPPSPGGPPAPAPGPVRVLVLTATSGFRHGSIASATTVMNELAATTGEFTVSTTEDVPSVTSARLASVDVLMFMLTSGELPFDAGQRAAILSFVNNGGGFVGVHSATDTLYGWPEYGQIVGAYFHSHPWTQEGLVVVENPSHPAAAPVAPSFRIREEFYTFRENPRPRVQVLLTLDPDSVNGSGDLPLAWSQEVGAGRTYYNALGHFDETWRDPRFQAQMRGAIRWVARR